MNRSAMPGPTAQDLLSPDVSPAKGRGKPAKTGKVAPMDIHNSWYVEAEQPRMILLTNGILFSSS